MGREDSLDALCRALADEPLLQLSLGSKELFHSNLLAWMCERFPQAARRVLSPWLHPSADVIVDRVRREYKHLDLVIEFAGFRPIVIENKMFALPDETQLDRYAATVLDRIKPEPTLILLSLIDPGWPDGRYRVGNRRWQRVSYQELVDRLRAEFSIMTGFDAAILTHEAEFLDLLLRIIDHVSVSTRAEVFALPPSTLALLDSVRLVDAIGKIRAHQVMGSIRDQYSAEHIQPTRTEVGFSNGQPLLASFWLGSNGDGVGWQYQAGQWRIAMILKSLYGRGAQYAGKRAAYAKTQAAWFDFRPLHTILNVADVDVRPRSTIGLDGFNKFDPDFVYRYCHLPTDTTVCQFIDLAVAFGRAAESWHFMSA